jgi:hypothetical protein
VTPRDSLEAGLTVMAMDDAAERNEVVDLTATWRRLDEALEGSERVAA